MGLTRIMRYFVVAVAFHAGVLFLLGSVKIVAYVTPILAEFVAPPDTFKPSQTEPDDPYAVYRDFEYTGPNLGGGGGSPGKGPGGVPTAAGGTPEQYSALVMAAATTGAGAPESVADVIGVQVEELTVIARTSGGPGGIATPRMGLGDTKIGTPGIKGLGGNIMGARMGPRKSVAMTKYEMPMETETAVMAALRWLKKNQRPDGSWPCVVRDVGGSALATLAFLGHGETPESKEFGTTVHKALEYLVSKVNAEGAVEGVGAMHGMYGQGLVTLALAEGYVMTSSPFIKDPLERATQFIVKAQGAAKAKPTDVGGWRYTPTSNDSDLSVTGWQIMALKSAKNAGINVPQEVFDQASKYLWATYGNNGFGYTGPGPSPGMTGVGVLCAQFLGHGEDERVKRALRFLRDQDVEWEKTRGSWVLYAWYYITQAMFQGGPDVWPSWNSKIRDIVKHQADDGHWPCPPGSDWEFKEASKTPAYATAICCLTLEVYYRYLPLYEVLELERKKAGTAAATPAK